MANSIEQGLYSINKYLHDNYTTTAINYQGLPHFDTGKHDEWIEPTLLGPVGVPARSNQQYDRWILNVNIYSRVDIQTTGNRRNLYRAAEIADVLATLFEKGDVPYLSTANVYLSSMRFGEKVLTDLGVDEGIMGLNISFDCWVIRAI